MSKNLKYDEIIDYHNFGTFLENLYKDKGSEALLLDDLGRYFLISGELWEGDYRLRFVYSAQENTIFEINMILTADNFTAMRFKFIQMETLGNFGSADWKAVAYSDTVQRGLRSGLCSDDATVGVDMAVEKLLPTSLDTLKADRSINHLLRSISGNYYITSNVGDSDVALLKVMNTYGEYLSGETCFDYPNRKFNDHFIYLRPMPFSEDWEAICRVEYEKYKNTIQGPRPSMFFVDETAPAEIELDLHKISDEWLKLDLSGTSTDVLGGDSISLPPTRPLYQSYLDAHLWGSLYGKRHLHLR